MSQSISLILKRCPVPPPPLPPPRRPRPQLSNAPQDHKTHTVEQMQWLPGRLKPLPALVWFHFLCAASRVPVLPATTCSVRMDFRIKRVVKINLKSLNQIIRMKTDLVWLHLKQEPVLFPSHRTLLQTLGLYFVMRKCPRAVLTREEEVEEVTVCVCRFRTWLTCGSLNMLWRGVQGPADGHMRNICHSHSNRKLMKENRKWPCFLLYES